MTPELNLSESLIGDQQNLLEKSQPAELNVSRDEIKDNILFHDKTVQTDLWAFKSPEWNRRTLNYKITAVN